MALGRNYVKCKISCKTGPSYSCETSILSS